MTKTAHQPWNKGRRVGARHELSHQQVRQIQAHLKNRGSSHDFCLFMVAVDTMLRADNLLQLRVCDVLHASGKVVQTFPWKQNKSTEPLFPVLTTQTQRALQTWLDESQKQPEHFLFTRQKPIDQQPISAGFYRRLIKRWVAEIGLYHDQYSGHSLRRTKAIFMFENEVPVAVISRLLGHKSEVATMHYLGITNAIARTHALENNIFEVPR